MEEKNFPLLIESFILLKAYNFYIAIFGSFFKTKVKLSLLPIDSG